jgi:hypothetical protein
VYLSGRRGVEGERAAPAEQLGQPAATALNPRLMPDRDTLHAARTCLRHAVEVDHSDGSSLLLPGPELVNYC